MALNNEKIFDIEEVSEEYKERFKDDAFISLKLFLGEKRGYINVDRSSYELFPMKFMFSSKGSYFISSTLWNRLRETIQSRQPYDISTYIEDDAIMEKVYSTLFHWESMYRNQVISLDECMIGLYREYMSYPDTIMVDEEKVDEEEEKKEEEEDSMEELKDKALTSIENHLGKLLVKDFYEFSRTSNNYYFVGKSLYIPGKYSVHTGRWNYVCTNLPPLPIDVSNTDYNSIINDPVTKKIYNIYRTWSTMYDRDEDSNLDECLRSMYKEFINLPVRVLAAVEEEERVTKKTYKSIGEKVEEEDEVDEKEDSMEELKDKALTAIENHLGDKLSDTSHQPLSGYRHIFIEKCTDNECRKYHIFKNKWDSLCKSLAPYPIDYRISLARNDAVLKEIYNIYGKWSGSYFRNKYSNFDECLRSMYKEFISLPSAKENDSEVSVERDNSSEDTIQELKNKALDSIKRHLGDSIKNHPGGILEKQKDVTYKPSPRCHYLFIKKCDPEFSDKDHIYEGRWDYMSETLTPLPIDGSFDHIFRDPMLEKVYDIYRKWSTMYDRAMDFDECLRGMYKEFISLPSAKKNDGEASGSSEVSNVSELSERDISVEDSIRSMEMLIKTTEDPEVKIHMGNALYSLRIVSRMTKTSGQRLSDFHVKYPDILEEFVKFDDPAKLLLEDTNVARKMLNTILAHEIDIQDDAMAVRILQQLVHCKYPATKKIVLDHFKALSPNYDICILEYFPKEFEEYGLDAKKALKYILTNQESSVMKAFIYGPDRNSEEYVEDRIYLFDNERLDRFNVDMNIEYFPHGKDVQDAIYKRENRIKGTVYQKFIGK